jgi:hypothetical protein
MENGPFIVDLPIENCDFPWLCDSLPYGNLTVRYGKWSIYSGFTH